MGPLPAPRSARFFNSARPLSLAAGVPSYARANEIFFPTNQSMPSGILTSPLFKLIKCRRLGEPQHFVAATLSYLPCKGSLPAL